MTSLIFELNEIYNRKLEQKISTSILAVGGISSLFVRNKFLSWISQTEGILLDVGCGDRKWEKLIPKCCRYLSLDYLPAASSSPWRVAYPEINADGMRLPFRDNCIDGVMNMSVLEHVRSPQLLIQEFARVLKPGGLLLLLGPGDITLSHGEPNNFFNLTRYAYYLLLETNDFMVQEEYYPCKFWLSIFALLYMKIVRNGVYNNHPALKLLQLFVLSVSLIVSPLLNILALILDGITPFDKRGYSAFMVLARKRQNSNVAATSLFLASH